MNEEWHVVWFTVWVSILSTLFILPFGIMLAWWLARSHWKWKSLIETIVALPLVMPPVATGLILLKLFGKYGTLGQFLDRYLGIEIVFTWKAVVAALSVMSFPLLVRTARVAFEEVNPRLEQVARTLGASQMRVFSTITLPLAMRGILAGTVLAFARALGEFGATIFVAGNIPGRTSTLSLAIFQFIQLGRDQEAIRLLNVSIFLAFIAVWLSEWFIHAKRQKIL